MTRKQTKICRELEWIRPYLELGMTYVSAGSFVERIGLWSYGNKKSGKNCYAALYRADKGPCRIWIHRHFDEHRLHSRMDILKILAHELAHIEEWEHTPKHESLCSKITIAYMKMLRQDGYISEEFEMEGA